MARRQLPLFGAPYAAPASAEDASVTVDRRCLAIVCTGGLDAAARWLSALHDALGEAVPLVYAVSALPVSALARALLARGRPFASRAPSVPEAGAWLMISDAQVVPTGARALIVLGERIPTRVPDIYAEASAIVRGDRIGTAQALARGFATGHDVGRSDIHSSLP